MIQKFLELTKAKKRTYTVYRQPSSDEKEYVVTVITPVYNGEKFLTKSIDSVIEQSIGFDNIEYILIDDCSTDQSKEIISEYAAKYDNIVVVSLDCNSGSPGRPRNIGIELASSPYITFLDADDWLAPNGIQSLYDILEETGDPYVVGRTIKVDNKGLIVIGDHQCCKERRSVSPFSIPHIFHHLGPTARMMRTSIVREQQIKFPEMKFAEDKQFFIDVLTHCKTISTTKKPIYYANRLNDTVKTRLTNQTNILQKTNYNLKTVRYILKRGLDVEIEKMIVNRMYEYDLMRRMFTTPHFKNTKLKFFYYYLIKQMLKSTKKLPYNISENFLQPIHKVIYELILEGKYGAVTKLLEWDEKTKVKDVIIQNEQPYYVTPFSEEKYKYIPVPMYITFKDQYCEAGKYNLHFQVFGGQMSAITDVLLRDGKNAHNDFVLPVTVNEKGEGVLKCEFVVLNDLPPAFYSIFVRYNDYMKTNIRQLNKNEMTYPYGNREYKFFHTSSSNVALRIK